MRMPSDKAANAPVFDIDPAFGKMAVAMGQATWGLSDLSQREKCLACLAADVCLRDLDLGFQMHIQMALANEVPIEDVHEAILQSAIEAGHTGALQALKRFSEVCTENRLARTDRDSATASDMPVQYFARLSRNIDSALLTMWKPLMAQSWSRGGLSPKERAFIALSGNVLQGVFGEPFDHHI